MKIPMTTKTTVHMIGPITAKTTEPDSNSDAQSYFSARNVKLKIDQKQQKLKPTLVTQIMRYTKNKKMSVLLGQDISILDKVNEISKP